MGRVWWLLLLLVVPVLFFLSLILSFYGTGFSARALSNAPTESLLVDTTPTRWTSTVSNSTTPAPPPISPDSRPSVSVQRQPQDRQRAETSALRATAVKAAFVHAWNAYRQYVWGQDELHPMSRSAGNWGGIGLTIVDSMDTAALMGLDDAVAEATEWVQSKLSFDRDHSISVFEVTIRELGGLLSMHALTQPPTRLDQTSPFLRKAVDLADRLLGAFATPTGYPHSAVNLRSARGNTPQWMAGQVSLSEIGSLQMEFITLSQFTRDLKYARAAHEVIRRLAKLQPPDGLYSIYLSQRSGDFTGSSRVTLGALGDSFFEYLLKVWLLTNRTATLYRTVYASSAQGIIRHLVQRTALSNLTYIAESSSRAPRTQLIHKMDHLVCFAGGMFALAAAADPAAFASHLDVGAGVTRICHEMYARSPTGLGPEIIKFNPSSRTEDFFIPPDACHYILRPEAVEAFFVLYRVTGDSKYQDWGWEAFQAMEKHCRVENGYAGVRDVRRVPPQHDDLQQSFFMAETLKYLYLLFMPQLAPLDRFVFNTEAHPLPVYTPFPELLAYLQQQ